MKVTGYQLIDTIERLREQAQTINSQFTSSLHRFPDGAEAKPDPRDLMERYLATEKRVAALQAAQATYNTQITVEVLGEPMSLQQAIKLIGSATRIKNNWLASGKNSNDATPYANYNDLVRAKDALYAERVVSVEESLRYSDEAAALVAALKQSIRSGNATEIEMNLDPALFR